jgi:transposase
MNAYSTDLRSKILAAVDAGMSKCQAAVVFGVSRSTIQRFAQLRRETGRLAPKPHAARPPRRIPAAAHDALRAQLEANADATLAEHCALWEQTQGVVVSVTTMHRAIARLNWTVKKRPWGPKNATSQREPPGKKT